MGRFAVFLFSPGPDEKLLSTPPGENLRPVRPPTPPVEVKISTNAQRNNEPMETVVMTVFVGMVTRECAGIGEPLFPMNMDEPLRC